MGSYLFCVRAMSASGQENSLAGEVAVEISGAAGQGIDTLGVEVV